MNEMWIPVSNQLIAFRLAPDGGFRAENDGKWLGRLSLHEVTQARIETESLREKRPNHVGDLAIYVRNVEAGGDRASAVLQVVP